MRRYYRVVIRISAKHSKTPTEFASRPYWSFSINYDIDAGPEQLWQMLPPKGSDLPMMQAKGTPSGIARQVCTIIKGKGGAVGQDGCPARFSNAPPKAVLRPLKKFLYQ